MGKPGHIYTAKVITYNGYEGIKIGRTSRPLSVRYAEHRASGDFRKFEPIKAWPVPSVKFVEGWIQGVLDQPTVAIAPGFREVYTATVSPEMVAEMAAHLANGRDAEYQKVLNRYNKLHPTDPTGPPWPNRPHFVPHATEPTAAEQYGVLILFATLAAMLFVPLLVKAVQIFCTDVAWFFSTYTVPFIIGAAWVALAAIPITACVCIWRYGMKAAEEIRAEDNQYAKQNTGFPTANPLTD